MPTPTLVVLVAIVAISGLVLALRRRRVTSSEPPWGAPLDRPRDLRALGVAHRSWPGSARDGVSDRTWSDLSFDAIFARLDRCVTTAGQQMLYRRLRQPSMRAAEVEAFDRRVRAFERDEGLRDGVRRALAPLAKKSTLTLAPIVNGAAPALPRAHRLIPLATVMTVGSVLASFAWPLAILGAVLGVIVSIGVRVFLQEAMTVHALALASLVDLVVSAQRIATVASDALSAEVTTLRAALASIEQYRAGMWWLSLDTSHLDELTAMFLTSLNVFFLLDVYAYMRSVELLRRRGGALRTLLETVGEIDAARSIASYRAGTKTCAPAFLPAGSGVTIEQACHPLVDDPVPNDVRLDLERGWLVMGSNMAGKSTYLRTIATDVLLAQSIACVPAERYEAPILAVRTMMRVDDDVTEGRSRFLAEAEAARDILLESREDGIDRLCIVDEPFRGTNTADRVAASGAFLRALHRERVFVVAATHDAELVRLLADSFLPHHFQESVEGSRLTFDYRVRAGAAAPRNALAVLELVGFPPRVLEDARALAATRDA